ncbi:MAG: cyclic pyranopterin monophosphate synthase MoaC [bacterium]|jgi:cyclic pyranopterin phosphate synthase
MTDLEFSHLDEQGRARMVDVGHKPVVQRIAEAEGFVLLKPETVESIRGGTIPKGDVFSVARVAAILGAKRTQDLIPMCHSLPLDVVEVQFETLSDRVRIISTVKCTARTGVEMEALSAVSIAALTIYDMCKAVDKEMVIEGIRLVKKEKIPLDK